MPEYRVRLVAEAGPDPVDGSLRSRDQETLVVVAGTRWDARSQALLQTTLRVMGRVLRTYDADTGEEIVLTPPDDFRRGQFAIDGLPGTYEGFTRGETWNGFAVPYFSLAEARRVADDYAAQPAGRDGQTEARYDENRDVIHFYDPSSGEWDEYGSIETGGTGRGPRVLYSVGGHYWTWDEV